MSNEVPEGWKATTLGATSNITGGSTPSTSNDEYWADGDIPWATPSDITALPAGVFEIDCTKRQITKRALSESSLRLLPPGTVLMTSRATIGHPAIATRDITTNQGFANFLPCSEIHPAYLVQWIVFNRGVLEAKAGGSTFKEVSKTSLRSQDIILPPLSEQKKIAAILTSVDEAIAATEALVAQNRRVKQGVLKHLLTRGIGHTRFKQTEIGEIPEGWEVKRLGSISERITSGSRGWASYYSDEGELFLRSQNIRNGCVDLTDRQHVTIPDGSEGVRTRVAPLDLLFTITGNGVGNVAIAPDDLGPCYVSQHIGLVRLKDRRLANLAVAYFSPSGPGNEQIAAAQYGQSKPGLSLDNLRSFLVPVPPATEAEKLAEAISDYGNAERLAIQSREAKIALKSALMSDLLTGRKRVSLP